MPFYEYECKACGHHLEAMQKFSDAPLKKCPNCGKSQLVKLISAPVFRLKGSGWYETDFKSDQDKKRNLAVEKDEAPAPEKDKPKEEKKDTAAGDKPAEKPAEKSGEKSAEKSTIKEASTSASKSSKPAAKPASKPKPAARRKPAPAKKSRRR